MAPRFITPHQRRRISQAIRDGHLAFLAEMFGPTAIDREDYERLRESGKIRFEKIMPQDAAASAHALGAVLSEGTVEHVRPVHQDPHVMMEDEREAVALVRDRIGQHVRGLGNKLDTATGHILVDADQKLRRRKLTSLRRETAHGVQERAAAEEVTRRVRDATKDMRREWLRTVHTEMHNTVEESKAVAIAGRHPSRDPRVFVRPRPDACAYCRLLYLRPDGVTPRVFRLSTLLSNGSNVGRKANRPTLRGAHRTEWKPVVGSAHPFCACQLNVLYEGMGFNSTGEMVYVGMKKSAEIELDILDKALVIHVCEE